MQEGVWVEVRGGRYGFRFNEPLCALCADELFEHLEVDLHVHGEKKVQGCNAGGYAIWLDKMDEKVRQEIIEAIKHDLGLCLKGEHAEPDE